MAATNKLLAKRVDELTEALTEVHDDMREALTSGDIDGLEETSEHIKDLLGLDDADDDSDAEGSDEEMDEDETEE